MVRRLQQCSMAEFSAALVVMYILAQGKQGRMSNEWTKQADTWPSVEDMKQSLIYYLKDGFEKLSGKSAVLEGITGRINAV